MAQLKLQICPYLGKCICCKELELACRFSLKDDSKES